ncbi:MAG: DUF349 domain-containing protein [Gammaproteobacteria bacterium]|nr:DUF349 domain-containing protein [Gammaproteobacteria bacterium]
MLKKLIQSVGRRRWEHDDPDIRAKAASQLDPENSETEAILLRLAREDTELSVRRAAIGRLTRSETLLPLIGSDDIVLASAAAERMGEIADEKPLPEAALQDPKVLERVSCHATEERVALATLERIHAPETLAELAVNAVLARVRHAAVQRLMDEVHLSQVEKQSRSSDKTVHRAAREKLDRIRHLRQVLADSRERLMHLLESAEKLAMAATDPMYARRLDHLSAQWQSISSKLDSDSREGIAFGLTSEPVDAFASRFDAALARARARIDAPTTPESAEVEASESRVVSDTDAPTPGDQAAAASPGGGENSRGENSGGESSGGEVDDARKEISPEVFENVLASLDALRDGLTAQFDLEALAQAGTALEDDQARWLAASDQRPPPDNLGEKFHEICHALKELVEANQRFASMRAEFDAALARTPPDPGEPTKTDEYQQLWRRQREERDHARRLAAMLRKVRWPDGFATPDTLANASERCAALDAFDQQLHAVHERLQQQLHKILDHMQESVDAGSLRSATGFQGEGKRILRSLPHGSGHGLQRRFTALSGRVHELKDWETFATAPKREALCVEMEALVRTPLAPEVQAPNIKELREAWRDLGPPVSTHDRRLLGRFNDAAEKAFAPCRTYFEEQSELRRWNLDNRLKMCDELERFLRDNDWSSPDWRAVEQILRTAQVEWRNFSPVDRTGGRNANDRFRKVMDDLRNRMNEEWNRNIEAKEAIVHDAERARDEQTVHDAAEMLKNLQRRWQSVGVTPRRTDQKLWKSFRDICDAVFSARDQEHHAHREAIEGQLREAESICEQLEQTIDMHHIEEVSKDRLQDVSRRFNQLELPRESASPLQTRFDRAVKAYRGLLAQAAHAHERSALRRLLTLEETLARSEARLIAGEVLDAESMQSEIVLTDLPAGMEEALAPRLHALLEAIASNDPISLGEGIDEAHEARRRIVIKCEILAGVDSPESDQPLRLEQQVERLSRGMGSRVNVEESPEEMIAAWCAAGPDIPEHSRSLRERFSRALDESLGAVA